MDYSSILQSIESEIASAPREGAVADYIPELAGVPPDRFGMSLRQVDGTQHHVGHCDERFSAQSIAKVLALALALRHAGEEIWERVGVEPSGSPFNSLVQLEYERGIPRNPLINPGAIVVCDILVERLAAPGQALLDFVRETSGLDSVDFNPRVARSEARCGFRNYALANLIKSFGNVRNDVDVVLDLYFHLCSIEMSCVELASAFRFLADRDRGWGISESQIKRINAIMQTCGFYDEAGEFAFRVGLPGKSGVGGGIVAVLPREYTVAVWSPRLNARGNSYLGMLALERLTSLTGWSVF